MPLKIKNIPVTDGSGNIKANAKSEDILIKKIKFNDKTHENANVRGLKQGNSKAWVESYNISAFNGDTNKVDPATIKVIVANGEACSGVGNRTIIDGNSIVSTLSDAEKLLYYKDSITISANGKKGYNDPTINNDGLSSISSDIDLNNHISAGGLLDCSDLTIVSASGYNPYEEEGCSVTVNNPNSFSVVGRWGMSSSSSTSPTQWYTISDDIGAGQNAQFSINYSKIASRMPSAYVHVQCHYGDAWSGETTQRLVVDENTPDIFIVPQYDDYFDPNDLDIGTTYTFLVYVKDGYHCESIRVYFNPSSGSEAAGVLDQPSANDWDDFNYITFRPTKAGTGNLYVDVWWIYNQRYADGAYINIEINTPTYNGGGGNYGCVSSDTNILMADGTCKRAELVHKDDVILAYDENRELKPCKIINKYTNKSCDLYRILLENNKYIDVTANHPILTQDGYKNIFGLNDYPRISIHDYVYTIDGYAKIMSINKISENNIVYNFYNEYDNFIANDVVVACENPDQWILGVNCFEITEGGREIVKDTDIGGPTVGCVSSDTNILMADGSYKRAELVHKDDVIMAYDENRELKPCTVINRYYSDICNKMISMKLKNGKTLDFSLAHPILTNRGYATYINTPGYLTLKKSDLIFTTDGLCKIEEINEYENSKRVWNFYNEYDNFIANDVVVACENLDKIVMGVNCFETPEGVSKSF